ncbi:hypothetical protein SAMN05421770_11172 [Granulicella rosea]|uniref:Organic solvent tolerance-like N-terminal domain-containing protein n=1 Tax=Granulicella rosea TaxID=474952 RepID=A0A239MDQ5_9BACT|nr:hypothetical protein [Granulicella rosea]SNT40194.1 hypothetical protein SAMN05421770_11172 [Granulicella rosea]
MSLLRDASHSLLLLAVLGCALHAQEPNTETKPLDAPLPDISNLMHEVERQQRVDESIQKDYIYHEATRFEEVDGHGQTKKVVAKEFDIFWINGVNVRRQTKKDGRDLTPDELRKENERIDKEVAKGRERRDKADAKGKETDSQGNEEITVSRLLELGSFSNERRIALEGRDTIVVDFAGNPKAKTHSSAESALKVLAGTVWIDEHDRSIVQLEGRMMDNFKVGGGLVLNVHKDTNFALHNRKVNGEAWLPVSFEAHGQARILLFDSLNGNVHAQFGDYRKFKTKSTLLPGMEELPPEDKPQDKP